MILLPSHISLFAFLLWVMLTLFSLPAGAVNPPGSYGGSAIAAGWSDSVALNSNGTAWAWGYNNGSWATAPIPTALRRFK